MDLRLFEAPLEYHDDDEQSCARLRGARPDARAAAKGIKQHPREQAPRCPPGRGGDPPHTPPSHPRREHVTVREALASAHASGFDGKAMMVVRSRQHCAAFHKAIRKLVSKESEQPPLAVLAGAARGPSAPFAGGRGSRIWTEPVCTIMRPSSARSWHPGGASTSTLTATVGAATSECRAASELDAASVGFVESAHPLLDLPAQAHRHRTRAPRE